MIKLTTTQAKAVASKIRERIILHNADIRKKLRDSYIDSDDYKNKQREVHETLVTVYQTSLKVGLTLGVGVSGKYCSGYMYKLEDVKSVEKNIMDCIINKYIQDNDTTKCAPSEESLVTDLIFESLTSDGVEELMNKFIEQYL